MKIYNPKAIGTTICAGGEVLKFDTKGIAEVSSPELHAELITLANYFPVEEEVVEPEVPKEEVKKEIEEEVVEKKTTTKKATTKK